jgi:hypothetical protein
MRRPPRAGCSSGLFANEVRAGDGRGLPLLAADPPASNAARACDLSSATRQVARAEHAARNGHEVWMGDEADRLINQGMRSAEGGKLPSADAVAKLENGHFRVYEAKGSTEVGKAVKQLEHRL